MSDSDASTTPTDRLPATAMEHVTGNLRPQPAIPAVIVLLLTVIFSVLAHDPAATESSAWLWLAPVGIVASCGLAIAAGFCSFVPQLAWIVLAFWAARFAVDGGPLHPANRWVLIAGIAAAVAMIGVQFWRVRTGRFVPTIRDARAD